MIQLFDKNLRYTEAGLQVCREVHHNVIQHVDRLLDEGYNWRTVIGPASVPCVDAADYNCDPKEFHALWIGEVMDICLDKLLEMKID